MDFHINIKSDGQHTSFQTKRQMLPTCWKSNSKICRSKLCRRNQPGATPRSPGANENGKSPASTLKSGRPAERQGPGGTKTPRVAPPPDATQRLRGPAPADHRPPVGPRDPRRAPSGNPPLGAVLAAGAAGVVAAAPIQWVSRDQSPFGRFVKGKKK